MLDGEDLVALGLDPAEGRLRPGVERQRIVAGVRVAVEQHVALADLGEGIALLRQQQRDLRLAALDRDRTDRVADPHLRGQRRHRAMGGIGQRLRDADARQRVARPRCRADRRCHLAGLVLDRRHGRRGQPVIIAFGPQQPLRHLDVVARSRRDLRGVGGLLLAVLEFGEAAELRLQPDLLEPLDLDRIADARILATRHLRVAGVGRGIEAGERRQRLRQSGIGDGRRRRRRCRRGLCGSGHRGGCGDAVERRKCGVERGIGGGIDRLLLLIGCGRRLGARRRSDQQRDGGQAGRERQRTRANARPHSLATR